MDEPRVDPRVGPQIDPNSVKTSLLLVVGPAVFLLHFAAVYAFNAIACARGAGAGPVPLFVLAATIIASALVLVVPLIEWRAMHRYPSGGHTDRAEYDPPSRRAFVGHLATRISALALGAMWLVALPTMFAQPCG